MSWQPEGPTALVVCAAPMAERAGELVRALTGAGRSVVPVLTPEAARNWVDVETLKSATGEDAVWDFRQPGTPRTRAKPSAVIVAPLTFNTLNKWALGISDNRAMGTLNEALGRGVPIVAVPIVNDGLWAHPALPGNLTRLQGAGVHFLNLNDGQPGAAPVRSGTGADLAARFDPLWIVQALANSPV